MNKLILLIALILSGCASRTHPVVNSPIPVENYDEEVLKAKASSLNMRYVDYLHALTNNKIPDLRRQASVFYQAHDPNWANEPSINPVFDTEAEAKEYAKRNNMSDFKTGHSYIVREVNYRYEVRQVNDAVNDVLYTSRTHNEAYEYVVEYSSAHADLIIYDLKTGESFEETP